MVRIFYIMISGIKDGIWELLKEKEISLGMIFNGRGEIIWQRGREIAKNTTTLKNYGYSSTAVAEAIKHKKRLQVENYQIQYEDLQRIESARRLKIKSLIILPITDDFFLYLDSGTKLGFCERDVIAFETLGAMLGHTIRNMRSGQGLARRFSGHSTAAADICEKIVTYAIEEEPVLILGETGVGKSHIAELIHDYSGRTGPFVVVNTPGIPENLLEAQLFGHIKGAFSGAVSDNEGFVGVSQGGTLFLDEIADIPYALQSKLLRFLDTHMYNRVGEPKERLANVRILTATNRDLNAAISHKQFREDLYFRLNCLTLKIPPLRERIADIADLLTDHAGLLRGCILDKGALAALYNYHWPGNVRELIQLLKKVGIHHRQMHIGSEIKELLAVTENGDAEQDTPVFRAWQAMKAGATFWQAVKEPYLNRDLNREQVKAIVAKALQQSGGRYMAALPLFNLRDDEYKPFISFLYHHKLQKEEA